jgi:hypothetical protein
MTDIGCGSGGWLAVGKLLGLEILGRDGNRLAPEEMLIGQDEYVRQDLSQAKAGSGRRFDLCLSLETAEHLPESSAEDFIKFLCAQSDLVMFSAAIPGQSGTHHVNLRWTSYWVDLFALNGYQVFDLIRSEFWHNYSVVKYYAQNTFVFCNAENISRMRQCQSVPVRPIIDAVHPRLWDRGPAADYPVSHAPVITESELAIMAAVQRCQQYFQADDHDSAAKYLGYISGYYSGQRHQRLGGRPCIGRAAGKAVA